LPKPGVYISITNNQPSLTFIGTRSTDNNFSIETHILNSKFQVPSSKLIEIEFLEFLRENRKFNNLTELKAQINNDIKKAEKLFTKNVY
jgi:riboflavin kinase/FMN adenylyltransferase